MTRSVTVSVPAKVNVQLAVGGLRPDGFHDLANVFLAVGLHDRVTATPSDTLRITVEGPDADRVPADRTNLAARAAELLGARYGIAPDVHLHITKAIPVAGGMAGGSADGAGALVACDALWGTGASREELLAICAELGSDVPFSLLGGAALGRGRGERLTPLDVGGTFHWVFAVADGGLSTPAVYRECDRLREAAYAERSGAHAERSGAGGTGGASVEHVPDPEPSPALLDALAEGDVVALASAMMAGGMRPGFAERASTRTASGGGSSNDLQAAAISLRPALAETLEAGAKAGALASVVSGSGPTCAFLARDAAAAKALSEALRASGTCRNAIPAASPAPGATMV
ncbi:4-(cytidine 5'-diphospho)-2-C-methyl-D-erythritol kinase [Streptomyces sp. NPDC051776]|uniref:4-(cytidine 5'-diphospho)-2-C-methyl-D-erythritol kinase n=1 Tax=Streptomyces sp. NPDC051776 TaxID=3155414 RepID=UPI003416FB34